MLIRLCELFPHVNKLFSINFIVNNLSVFSGTFIEKNSERSMIVVKFKDLLCLKTTLDQTAFSIICK